MTLSGLHRYTMMKKILQTKVKLHVRSLHELQTCHKYKGISAKCGCWFIRKQIYCILDTKTPSSRCFNALKHKPNSAHVAQTHVSFSCMYFSSFPNASDALNSKCKHARSLTCHIGLDNNSITIYIAIYFFNISDMNFKHIYDTLLYLWQSATTWLNKHVHYTFQNQNVSVSLQGTGCLHFHFI